VVGRRGRRRLPLPEPRPRAVARAIAGSRPARPGARHAARAPRAPHDPAVLRCAREFHFHTRRRALMEFQRVPISDGAGERTEAAPRCGGAGTSPELLHPDRAASDRGVVGAFGGKPSLLESAVAGRSTRSSATTPRVTLVVQVNGKVRGRLDVERGEGEASAVELAQRDGPDPPLGRGPGDPPGLVLRARTRLLETWSSVDNGVRRLDRGQPSLGGRESGGLGAAGCGYSLVGRGCVLCPRPSGSSASRRFDQTADQSRVGVEQTVVELRVARELATRARRRSRCAPTRGEKRRCGAFIAARSPQFDL
jgi:hypothetical protein